MMKDKKKLILIVSGVGFVVLISIICLIISSKNANTVINLMDNVFSKVVYKLDNTTISGNVQFKLNVDSIYSDTKIIDNMDLIGGYQVNLDKGYTNIDVWNTNGLDKVNSNIYITDGRVNLLMRDVYNKYIGYDFEHVNLGVLENISDYKVIIDVLDKELNKTLKARYFSTSIVKLNDKRVRKITLNLMDKDNLKLKKKIVSRLVDNKKFINAYSNITGYSKNKAIKEINKMIYKDYKLIVYASMFGMEILKVEIDSGKYSFDVKVNNNKYTFSYFVNDGVIYNGYIKIKNDNVSEINIRNEIDHYVVNMSFSEFSVNYNEEVYSLKHVVPSIYIDHDDIDEDVRDIINRNDMIEDIYNNYLKRDEVGPPDDVDVQDHV